MAFLIKHWQILFATQIDGIVSQVHVHTSLSERLIKVSKLLTEPQSTANVIWVKIANGTVDLKKNIIWNKFISER